jgi:hypothetical protein
MYPLITHDPITGEPLMVTRLEGPTTGIVIEGRFSLGWIGRLSAEQLEFVGVLVRNRGNLQKVAADMGASYNTARNRMDEIVEVLGGVQEAEGTVPIKTNPTVAGSSKQAILERLAAGEIAFDEAMRQIRG